MQADKTESIGVVPPLTTGRMDKAKVNGIPTDRVEELANGLAQSAGGAGVLELDPDDIRAMAEAMIRELTYTSAGVALSLHERIRIAAYLLWEGENRPPDRTLHFWLTAERTVWEALASDAIPGLSNLPRGMFGPG